MSELEHRSQSSTVTVAPEPGSDLATTGLPARACASNMTSSPCHARTEPGQDAISACAGELLPAPEQFPAPPGPAVYQGLLGEMVTRLAPETEADPVAILSQLLVAVGAAIGRGAYFQIGDSRHHPNSFVLIVGDSARSRKGTAWDHARALICHADAALEPRIQAGLLSGEGLVAAVADHNGNEPAAADPRLLVIEPEFASVLICRKRHMSTNVRARNMLR